MEDNCLNNPQPDKSGDARKTTNTQAASEKNIVINMPVDNIEESQSQISGREKMYNLRPSELPFQMRQNVVEKIKLMDKVYRKGLELQGAKCLRSCYSNELVESKKNLQKLLTERDTQINTETEIAQKTEITHNLCLEMKKSEKNSLEVLEKFYFPGLRKHAVFVETLNKSYDDLEKCTAIQLKEYDVEEKILNDKMAAIKTAANINYIAGLEAESTCKKSEIEVLAKEVKLMIEANSIDNDESLICNEIEELQKALMEIPSEHYSLCTLIQELSNEEDQLDKMNEDITFKFNLEDDFTKTAEDQLISTECDGVSLEQMALIDINESIYDFYLPENFDNIRAIYKNFLKMNEDINQDMCNLTDIDTKQKETLQKIRQELSFVNAKIDEVNNESILLTQKLNDAKQIYLDKMLELQTVNDQVVLLIQKINNEIGDLEQANNKLAENEINLSNEFASNLNKYTEMNDHMESMFDGKTSQSMISSISSIPSVPSARVHPMQTLIQPPLSPTNILNISSEIDMSQPSIAENAGEEMNFNFSFIDDNESVVSQAAEDVELNKKPPRW